MNCSVCHNEAAPIKIKGENYCSNCGNKLATPPRRITDLAPAKPTVVTPTATTSKPVVRAVAPKPAAALHNPTKASHVIDLRANATTPANSVPAVQQAANHIAAAPPKTTKRERNNASASARLDEAKKIGRSSLVSRFAGAIMPSSLATTPPPTATKPPVTNTAAPVGNPAPARSASSPSNRELPTHVAAQHQVMSRLAPSSATTTSTAASSAAAATPALRPKAAFRFQITPTTSRVLAIGAAITIMSGYIWLENYPKFALQTASNRAGLTASLPGFVPSSYNLVNTETTPGLVTLSFNSPSATETLKIAQAKTDWDSSSLLDNFVIKNTDDYTTIQGQGLTIYLWGNNQAAWVNHGIRYSIEGAARLSREQILKIAYSL